MKEQSELIEKNGSLLKAQSETLSEVEKSMSESSDALNKLTGRVDHMEEEVNKIVVVTGEMKVTAINESQSPRPCMPNLAVPMRLWLY